MPFGGVKASGCGRFGGKAAIEEFTELRWITVQAGVAPLPAVAPRALLREIADSGTVELAPLFSQRTVAVPAFASTACTLPSSPVDRLRTCPGGSAVAVRSGSGFGLLGRRGAAPAGRFGGRAGGVGASSGRRCTFSSGTTFAPVPFVSVSSTQTFPITTVNYRSAPLAAEDAARARRRNYSRAPVRGPRHGHRAGHDRDGRGPPPPDAGCSSTQPRRRAPAHGRGARAPARAVPRPAPLPRRGARRRPRARGRRDQREAPIPRRRGHPDAEASSPPPRPRRPRRPPRRRPAQLAGSAAAYDARRRSKRPPSGSARGGGPRTPVQEAVHEAPAAPAPPPTSPPLTRPAGPAARCPPPAARARHRPARLAAAVGRRLPRRLDRLRQAPRLWRRRAACQGQRPRGRPGRLAHPRGLARPPRRHSPARVALHRRGLAVFAQASSDSHGDFALRGRVLERPGRIEVRARALAAGATDPFP